jgi:hypothetical protein
MVPWDSWEVLAWELYYTEIIVRCLDAQSHLKAGWSWTPRVSSSCTLLDVGWELGWAWHWIILKESSVL